jgi:hypothetical protein
MDVPDFVCYLTVLPDGWDEKTLETLLFLGELAVSSREGSCGACFLPDTSSSAPFSFSF